jgi:hypothetical protein
MKYKVGDKTLLGEIVNIDNYDTRCPYGIESMFGCFWFSESEIDKIIIKPKRNIDKIMELWDEGNHKDAAEIFHSCKGFTTYEDIVELRKLYIEPPKYPQLTPEELKAVKWLVDGGFDGMHRSETNVWVRDCARTLFRVDTMPTTKCLFNSQWITADPINLKELLDAQEVFEGHSKRIIRVH